MYPRIRRSIVKKLSGVLLTLLFAITARADEIHLQGGDILRGKIIQVTPQSIEYDPEGTRAFDIIPRGQISKIVYDDGSTVFLNEGATEPATAAERPLEQHTRTHPVSGQSSPAPAAGIHSHDGFYFRALLGFGPGTTTFDNYSGNELKYEGSATALRLQVGYAVMEDLILFLDNGGTAMAEPDVTYGGNDVDRGNSEVSFSDFGIGVTYYFMPYNIYLSASLLLFYTSFEGDYVEGDTDYGVGYQISIGKEWWISKNWGIGVALLGFYGKTTATIDADNSKHDVTSSFIGILFSATYN
jgi:hypothetical protein